MTFGPHWENVQILFSGGLHYFDYTDLYQDDHLLKLAGLAIAFSRTGTSWLGASIGYGRNGGLDTFSIGVLLVSERL